MPELKLGDATLNYEIDDFTDPWEKPETVLLHHGCGKHGRFWYRWPPILARKYRVIRLDARGFGKSSDPGPDFQWSMEGFARDVIGLMDHLEIPQIYFVGEYMGAWTGIQLALDYPQRVKKLVFTGMPYFWTTPKSMVDAIDTVGVQEWQLADEPYRFGGDAVYGRWFADEMARSRTHVVKSVIQAAGGVDYRPRLSEIKCPVMVLLGELYVKKNDESAPALMREKLPRSSEVVIIKGGPMFAIYTMAERCARLCMDFFERQD